MRNNLPPFPDADPAFIAQWRQKLGYIRYEPTSWYEERNKGIQVQYATSVGKHDIISSLTYDKSMRDYKIKKAQGLLDYTWNRKSVIAYIQDKIHINNKWDFTPALRYSYYSNFDTTRTSQKALNSLGKEHFITGAINTEYMINNHSNLYLGWTQIYRPLRQGDYLAKIRLGKNKHYTKLLDERGDVFTFGYTNDISDSTSIGVHYSLMRMRNAIAKLPIQYGGLAKVTAINAKENKKSFNITVDHQFNDHLSANASYMHVQDKWGAKDGWDLDPLENYKTADDINTQINRWRPQNHYALNLTYENGRLYTGLLFNWYTGASTKFFTDNRFLIVDWNINYDITKDLTAYFVVNNLTNEAYELTSNTHNGIGGAAMPSRNYMVGARYKF